MAHPHAILKSVDLPYLMDFVDPLSFTSSQPLEHAHEPSSDTPGVHQQAGSLPKLDSLSPPYLLLANPPYLIHMHLHPSENGY